MSIHLTLFCEGHLEKLYHVFLYLNKYHNSELVLNPSDQVIDQAESERKYWTSSNFGHVLGKYDIKPNILDPRGLGFMVMVRVDAYHIGYTVTRRSGSVFIIYVNSASVYCMLKKQTSCYSLSFDTEIFSMKIWYEYICGIR